MRLHKHPDYPNKTKYDGLAHYLYRTNKPSTVRLQPLWKNLKLKDKDYWRGLAQVWKGQDL